MKYCLGMTKKERVTERDPRRIKQDGYYKLKLEELNKITKYY